MAYYLCFKVHNLAREIFQQSPLILTSETAWHQNLALIQKAQKLAHEPSLKGRIRFLAVNYLNKIAPLTPLIGRILSWNFFESSHQLSRYSVCMYHRCLYRYRPDISSSINQKRFALGDKSPLILTDTTEFAHFLPLHFAVLNRSNQSEWRTLISEACQQRKPLLFDLTDDLQGLILTEGEQSKETQFTDAFAKIKNEIQKIDLTSEEKTFIEKTSTSIVRCPFDCHGTSIGGIKVLPLFKNLNPKNIIKEHPEFTHSFLEESGIVLNPMHLRRLIPSEFPLPENFQLPAALAKPPEQQFSHLNALCDHPLFKTFEVEISANSSSQPHVEIMGKTFFLMLRKLNEKIPQNREDEAIRKILDGVYAHLFLHLQKAHSALKIEDQNAFLQAMELAYAELGTILELTRPYSSLDFQKIYSKVLQPAIPSGLSLKCGLGKTAETFFAAMNAALRIQKPNPVFAWSEGLYFEHANFLKGSKKFDIMMPDEEAAKIDFYACTFHPSINAKDHEEEYVQRNLQEDIQKILALKSTTESLTVAIDFTNDDGTCEKLKSLFNYFKKEIQEGRLNFALFGSGQKFDMLGMDHFYGSPFFLVNNGEACWDPFNLEANAKINETDLFSHQWFSLLYEAAPASTSNFRKLFFENHRKVIENIPEKLFIKERTITVSRVAKDVNLSFIDVKIKGIFNRVIASLLIAYFYFHSVVSKVKASIRGSFGFLHPNATLIFAPHLTTLRLHAGLLSSDNFPIVQFLRHLA